MLRGELSTSGENTTRGYIYTYIKAKVKRSRYRADACKGIALHYHDRGTRRFEWTEARRGRSSPQGNIRYPFYRRLGGPQGLCGRPEYLVPTGIRCRTVGSVALSIYSHSYTALIYICVYTGCNRRKGPDFGGVFLMLNYTEKPQNTYIQS